MHSAQGLQTETSPQHDAAKKNNKILGVLDISFSILQSVFQVKQFGKPNLDILAAALNVSNSLTIFFKYKMAYLKLLRAL